MGLKQVVSFPPTDQLVTFYDSEMLGIAREEVNFLHTGIVKAETGMGALRQIYDLAAEYGNGQASLFYEATKMAIKGQYQVKIISFPKDVNLETIANKYQEMEAWYTFSSQIL